MTDFWFGPTDPVRLEAFRFFLGLSLLAYSGAWWQNAEEWLTPVGFHPSPGMLLSRGLVSAPLLSLSALPWFGLFFLGGISSLLMSRQNRWTEWWVFGCVLYVTFADLLSAYTLNLLFLLSFLALALAPRIVRQPDGSAVLPSAWPIRILQATLLVQYFGAGLCKVVSLDWLRYPDVLWTQIQGWYRTELAAWMLQAFPGWSWTLLQFMALGFELSAPLLFGFKPLRKLGFLLGIGFHGMIALTMHRLIYFSLQMLCFYVLFMEDQTLQQWKDRLLQCFPPATLEKRSR